MTLDHLVGVQIPVPQPGHKKTLPVCIAKVHMGKAFMEAVGVSSLAAFLFGAFPRTLQQISRTNCVRMARDRTVPVRCVHSHAGVCRPGARSVVAGDRRGPGCDDRGNEDSGAGAGSQDAAGSATRVAERLQGKRGFVPLG